MNKKGFTLIELLIVIAIIGILAGIVIVSLSGSTDNAEDAAVKANLRSVATLYAEVFADDSEKPSLCKNTKVQEAMKTVFGKAGVGSTDETNPETADPFIYTDGDLGPATEAGCVSNNDGNWVVWADLSKEDGMAWCVDSAGKNGVVDASAGDDDIYAIDNEDLVATGTSSKISCESIKNG